MARTEEAYHTLPPRFGLTPRSVSMGALVPASTGHDFFRQPLEHQ